MTAERPGSRPVAVVTGSANGIGLAIARRLSTDGYDLVLTSEQSLDEVRAGLQSTGTRVFAQQADFRDAGSAGEVVQAGADHFGRLDVLVNNAGLTRTGALAQLTAVDLDEVLSINLKAPWLAIKAAAPYLSARGGSVVNVSSVHAGHGLEGHSIYGASKGGIEAMTRQLAIELAPRRIRVNAVAPGVVEVERYRDIPWYSPEAGARLVPWPRVGEPEDVAAAVAFLAGPSSEFITGEVLRVDGGTSARLSLDLPEAD